MAESEEDRRWRRRERMIRAIAVGLRALGEFLTDVLPHLHL